MYLSRYAAEVQIVIRRESLLDTMSQYLIDQIETTPNITGYDPGPSSNASRATAVSNASC